MENEKGEEADEALDPKDGTWPKGVGVGAGDADPNEKGEADADTNELSGSSVIGSVAIVSASASLSAPGLPDLKVTPPPALIKLSGAAIVSTCAPPVLA